MNEQPSELRVILAIASCAVLALILYSELEFSESQANPGGGDETTVTIDQLQRLSFDLRNRPLSETEKTEIGRAIASGGMKAYEQYLDRWLTVDSLKRFVAGFLRYPPVLVATPDAEVFFHRLSRYGSSADAVYYLPHNVERREDGAPCDGKNVESVTAWWSKKPVRVCNASYVPEKIFDEIGYCSGEAEPLMRQPPRPGCGCGPLLMGCLPPDGEDPKLDELVVSSPNAEYLETAARIVAEDRPLDEVVTTSRTWQTGLTEFLYLRRELIALHRKNGWNEVQKDDFKKRLATVDVHADGRWVERGGVYEGSGLWWTSTTIHAMKLPVRTASHFLLINHLCSDFHAVNVDADAILKAVNKRDKNLRTLSSFLSAPMRKEDGCKGCHAPMDGAAGFFTAIQASMYGSYPTGDKARGEFYVAGAGDFRGRGYGPAALASLIVSQPEFEVCSVRRAFEKVVVRAPRSEDQDLLQELAKVFKSNGHRFKPIIRRLLLSPAYMNEPALRRAPPTDSDWKPMDKVPEPVAEVVIDVCANCHDSSHAFDLERVPSPNEVAAWKKIFTRTNDFTMPLPNEGEVTNRFPMEPSVRRKFVRAVQRMLGPALDEWQPPRRMEHRVWISVAHLVGDDAIGAEKVDGILEPILKKDGFFAKLPPRGLPPAYEIAIGRASEQVCREVAQADASAGGKTYGLRSEGDWSDEDKRKSVTALWRAVYQQKPSDTELSQAVDVLDELQGVTGDRIESWAALCSTELSGPKLFFGAFIAGQ